MTDRKLTCDDVYCYLEDRPPVGTIEIAQRFDVSHMTARKRLQELVDNGRVVQTKIHETTVVWWVPNTGTGA